MLHKYKLTIEKSKIKKEDIFSLVEIIKIFVFEINQSNTFVSNVGQSKHLTEINFDFRN